MATLVFSKLFLPGIPLHHIHLSLTGCRCRNVAQSATFPLPRLLVITLGTVWHACLGSEHCVHNGTVWQLLCLKTAGFFQGKHRWQRDACRIEPFPSTHMQHQHQLKVTEHLAIDYNWCAELLSPSMISNPPLLLSNSVVIGAITKLVNVSETHSELPHQADISAWLELKTELIVQEEITLVLCNLSYNVSISHNLMSESKSQS